MPARDRSASPARKRSVSRSRVRRLSAAADDVHEHAVESVATTSTTTSTTTSATELAPPAPPAPAAERNPRTTEYEFFGPAGVVVVTTLCVVTQLFLTVFCEGKQEAGGAWTWPHLDWLAAPTAHLGGLFSTTAFAVFWGWIGFQVLLYLALPGRSFQGTQLRDGSRITYKTNAFACFLVSLAALALADRQGYLSLDWVTGRDAHGVSHFAQLSVAALASTLVGSVLLYAWSFRSPAVLLAETGNSGHAVYDFFMGREFNPSVTVFGQALDLKYFCELRPGLMGWAVLNLLFLWQQMNETRGAEGGDGGLPSPELVVVLVSQVLYVLDALWFEECIVTTMDIIMDGFGFMLCFGDLSWVPFTYTLQARFLASNPQHLGPLGIALVVALNLLGLYIFRSANKEKDDFRKDPAAPHVAHLTYLPTKRGSKLITNGWWGVSRHVNYFGDWLMGLSWCLATGFQTPVTYFYALYFAILLIHRERRDEHKCATKYGADWDRYKRIVPYRIIPFVY